jgi:LmbE family N-acetylglucosaminyl deacetylase
MKFKTALLFALSFVVLAKAAFTQVATAAKPDDRYKADILVLVAHPDDETEVTGYLARAIFDEHKRVAVIFGTRGNGGGNAQGAEQAAALGAEREIEGRRALNVLGVSNVWFLNGPDTPGQDVLRSLETWNHGASLEQAIRLVRLTRPEVILTWLPEYVAGENHGDHQAAGVIATEAFDMAGDPTVFPEQVSAPRDANNIGNLTEGLHPWQPKKLYYFTDASHTDFQSGKGPRYSTEDESPSKKLPYYRIAADEMSYHLTQDDTGQMATNAIKKGNFTYFREPVLLILGKSLVPGSVTGDILEGIDDKPLPFSPSPGYKPAEHTGLSMDLGGPWAFYRDFWQTHGLKALDNLLPNLEVSMSAGERIYLPIIFRNDTDAATNITLSVAAPDGWTESKGAGEYAVAAHETFPLYVTAKAPAATGKQTYKFEFTAVAGGSQLKPIDVNVYLTPGSLPQ